MNLVGVAEVAELLQISRQRVHQLVAMPGFPKPMAELTAGLIWDRRDIERWALAQGRLFPDDEH